MENRQESHPSAGSSLHNGRWPSPTATGNRRMAARRLNDPIEPMTLGNMRAKRRVVARRVMPLRASVYRTG
jgi:hypothetical protein